MSEKVCLNSCFETKHLSNSSLIFNIKKCRSNFGHVLNIFDLFVILRYFLYEIIPIPEPREHWELQYRPFLTNWSWWFMSSFNIWANFYRFPQISTNSEIQIWISGNFPSLTYSILWAWTRRTFTWAGQRVDCLRMKVRKGMTFNCKSKQKT